MVASVTNSSDHDPQALNQLFVHSVWAICPSTGMDSLVNATVKMSQVSPGQVQNTHKHGFITNLEKISWISIKERKTLVTWLLLAWGKVAGMDYWGSWKNKAPSLFDTGLRFFSPVQRQKWLSCLCCNFPMKIQREVESRCQKFSND